MSKQTKAARTVSLSIPLAESQAVGYEVQQADVGVVRFDGVNTLHVNVQLGPAPAKAFLSMLAGLRAGNAKLLDGKPVWTNADGLRWLMEQVAAAN
jgi:hypothetical protein